MKLRFSLRRKKKDDDADQAEESLEQEKPAKKKNTSGGGGGPNAIKQWLFLHSEKAVTVGIIVLLGMMVYSAIGKLQVPKNQTPHDLGEKVRRLEDRVTTSTFPETSFPVPSYVDTVLRGTAKVVEPPEGRPIVDNEGPRKRRDPKIFPPQYLEATAGNGIFFVTSKQPGLQGVVVGGGDRIARALANPLPPQLGGDAAKGDGTPEGRRWVAICAVIPYQAQVQEYGACFATSQGYDSKRDQPRFDHINMRRVEIVPGQPEIDWSEVAPIPIGKAQHDKLRATWSGSGKDPVSVAFRVAGLSHSLGPLAFDTWANWASHSRLIGLVPPQLPDAKTDTTPRRGVPRGRATGPRAAGEPDDNQPLPNVVTELKLVRIIDFDVQPGKSYRYQLQVVAHNPNGESRNLAIHFFQNPATRSQEFVRSEWSEPSSVVVVPHDARVFAASVDPPAEGAEFTEPVADVVIEVLEAANGAQPTGSMKLRRGEPVTGKAQIAYPGGGPKQVIVNDNANLDTDYTLLDFRPADPSTGAMDSVEMLFMDSNGNLIRSSAADDASKVDRLQMLKKALEAAPVPRERARPREPANLDQLEKEGARGRQRGPDREERGKRGPDREERDKRGR